MCCSASPYIFRLLYGTPILKPSDVIPYIFPRAQKSVTRAIRCAHYSYEHATSGGPPRVLEEQRARKWTAFLKAAGMSTVCEGAIAIVIATVSPT